MKIYQEVKKFKGRPFRYFVSVLPPDHVMHTQLQVAVDRRLTATGTRWMVRAGTRYADPDLQLTRPEGDSREFGERMSYDLDTALAIATLLAPKLSLRAMNGRTAADLINDDLLADSRRKVDEWRQQRPVRRMFPPPEAVVTPRPLLPRYRVSLVRLGRKPEPHGTTTRYGQGCRCTRCREALGDFYEDWRLSRRQDRARAEVYYLGLPTRVANALCREGIWTLQELVLSDISDLKDIRNIGRGAISQLEALIADAEDQLFFTSISLSGVIA